MLAMLLVVSVSITIHCFLLIAFSQEKEILDGQSYSLLRCSMLCGIHFYTYSKRKGLTKASVVCSLQMMKTEDLVKDFRKPLNWLSFQVKCISKDNSLGLTPELQCRRKILLANAQLPELLLHRILNTFLCNCHLVLKSIFLAFEPSSSTVFRHLTWRLKFAQWAEQMFRK